jgi:hypothetical protein
MKGKEGKGLGNSGIFKVRGQRRKVRGMRVKVEISYN